MIEDLLRSWDGEEVVTRYEEPLDTWIFICVHSTRLGPAGGGTRMLSYATPADAVADGMKLSAAMSRKMAVAGVPFGGGKAVLAVPAIPRDEERKELLRVYGQMINSLNGTFHTATDLNTTVEDMNLLSEWTPYAHGRAPSLGGAGASGPPTAVGVHHGIRASLDHAFGSPSLEGRSVLVQGLGGVGEPLAELLAEAGARLLVSDVDGGKADALATRLGAKLVPPSDVIGTECDVYAPCAVGGTIASRDVDRLGCRIVAGSANNQLADADAADRLRDRGILYAPDFVISAGGVIHLSGLEILHWERDEYECRLAAIGDTLREIFRGAESEGITTEQAAQRLADARLTGGSSPS